MTPFSGPCLVCGGAEFEQYQVLWPELIQEWQLSPYEVDYVNRQQGYCCKDCGNNLRSLALTLAICESFNFAIPLTSTRNQEIGKNLQILEINSAGGLSKYLDGFPGHLLVEYPEYDMLDLTFESASFDMVVHSDTLEHVPDPVRGLSECRRVLKPNGACIFTTPIVVDRLTRQRDGLENSYHGDRKLKSPDQKVYTEFGVDYWQYVVKAGFKQCSTHVLEWPAALAVVARG